MKVVVTGGSGFIGRALTASLCSDGHEATVLTRSASRPVGLHQGARAVRWPAASQGPGPAAAGSAGNADWRDALNGADAVVHLAGESIAARRWSPVQKERIRKSRIEGTRMLVEALAGLPQERRPRTLISGSAVGYYGDRGDDELTEAAAPGTDFLAELCTAWEAEARRAEELGVRVVLLRTGIVLDREGGALPRMLLPFRLFAGGPLGSGRQWMPWIHLADEVGLIRFALENEAASGPLNAAAPNPLTNREFSRVLGRVMRRPSWAPAPAFALRLMLGEMADALLLGGQRVLPEKAVRMGYRFRYPELEPALRAIMGS